MAAPILRSLIPLKGPAKVARTGSVVPSVRSAEPAAEGVALRKEAVSRLHERRRRRRATVAPMYTSAVLRVLSRKGEPIEGHVLNISETGMAVEVDSLVAVGQPVTVEFRVAGLGRIIGGQWGEFAAAAEVVRVDDLEDFPQGPYRIALKFVRISTMAQAQIARYIATHPG
jgi:c-di-GMP-binding flagellar brake protein YcgR